VIHTASPFHFNAKDIQKDLLDPAINGTKGVLEAIKASAPTVKRVVSHESKPTVELHSPSKVITSSFAAIIDPFQGMRSGYSYSEKDWNPITQEQALESQPAGYRGLEFN